jgi:hypothetical protein
MQQPVKAKREREKEKRKDKDQFLEEERLIPYTLHRIE